MPGPVLMSVVTSVGYIYGNITYGVGFGWLFGLLGFVLAVTATATGALSLYTVFEFLKNSHRLRMIVQYIMPVVCGMLVTTALSLLILFLDKGRHKSAILHWRAQTCEQKDFAVSARIPDVR